MWSICSVHKALIDSPSCDWVLVSYIMLQWNDNIMYRKVYMNAVLGDDLYEKQGQKFTAYI